MSKLDEALQDIIIDRDDGTPKYLACCFQDVEFGVIKHREGCSTVLARLELSALRARVEALEVFFAWEIGRLSEGQVARILGVDRLTAREMRKGVISSLRGDAHPR